MKRITLRISLAVVATIGVVVITLFLHTQSDIESPIVRLSPRPDSLVFLSVVRSTEQYRDSSLYASYWKIDANSSTGLVQTNWFPDHKGEITLKIQIVVRGTSFHIDVWQKLPFWGGIRKTEWSRGREYEIQSKIERDLKNLTMQYPPIGVAR
jgi:hypothetical protein